MPEDGFSRKINSMCASQVIHYTLYEMGVNIILGRTAAFGSSSI
jgi:hypothetical protein